MRVNTTFQLRTIFSLVISIGVIKHAVKSTVKLSFVDISNIFCVFMHVINNYAVFIGRFKADLKNLFIAIAVNGKLNHTCPWQVGVTSIFNLVE